MGHYATDAERAAEVAGRDRLRALNAELLAALEGILPLAEWALLEQSPPYHDEDKVAAARAARAKARGEAP